MDIRQLNPPQVQAGSAAELAEGNALLGTWKLQSYIVTTDAGEKSTPYGEHPNGYLSYSADGRMHAIGISDGRIAPQGAAPTDDERVTLYETMFAYAGTYTVGAGKVIHHVDISWNHVWTGTDQVRFYKLIGNTLTITASWINPAQELTTLSYGGK
jgi:Lipocalin-like domain